MLSVSVKKKAKKKKLHSGQPANLTRGRTGKPAKRKFVLPAAWDKFCIQVKLTGRPRQAAVRAGYHPDYAHALMRHPAIQERLKRVDEQMLTKELADARKDYVLHADLLDENLVDVVRSYSHERRGYADKVAAIRHGNELLGRVSSGKTTINNANQNTSVSAVGNNAFQIYEAEWLTEKKQLWSKELEAKHGSNVGQEPDIDLP